MTIYDAKQISNWKRHWRVSYQRTAFMVPTKSTFFILSTTNRQLRKFFSVAKFSTSTIIFVSRYNIILGAKQQNKKIEFYNLGIPSRCCTVGRIRVSAAWAQLWTLRGSVGGVRTSACECSARQARATVAWSAWSAVANPCQSSPWLELHQHINVKVCMSVFHGKTELRIDLIFWGSQSGRRLLLSASNPLPFP